MGIVTRLGRPDGFRLRPRALSLACANQAVIGDMVTTTHTGDDPHIEVDNGFGTGFGPGRKPQRRVVSGGPLLSSYAFRDGTQRGLILVNGSSRTSQRVRLSLPGAVAAGSVTAWRVANDDLAADNEPERPQPMVTLDDLALPGFTDGTELVLPRLSITAIRWRRP